MLQALVFILKIEAALCAIFGLWSHDWKLIFAGAFTLAMAPLVEDELVHERRRNGEAVPPTKGQETSSLG